MADTQIDKAVVTLAAQDIVSKFNKQIEGILKLEVADVMPLVDNIRTEFGPQKAEAFSTSCSEIFSAMKEGLLAAKLALGENVDALSSEDNDMATYEEPEEENQDDLVEPMENQDQAATEEENTGDEAPDAPADDIMKPSVGRDPKMIESIMESMDSDAFIINKLKEAVTTGKSAIQAINDLAISLDIDVQDIKEVAVAHLKKKV